MKIQKKNAKQIINPSFNLKKIPNPNQSILVYTQIITKNIQS